MKKTNLIYLFFMMLFASMLSISCNQTKNPTTTEDNPTNTPVYTETSTFNLSTATPTYTETTSQTEIPTLTSTSTEIFTSTPTNMYTDTFTSTPTFTLTNTNTSTPANTDTFTSTPTFTLTNTITSTFTSTPTFTLTPTNTPCFVLGNTGSFPIEYICNNRTYFQKFTLASEKTVTSIYIYNELFGTGTYKVGIYSEGATKTLITSSSDRPADSFTQGWNKITITATTLSPGDYWLAVGVKDSGGGVNDGMAVRNSTNTFYTKFSVCVPATWDGTYTEEITNKDVGFFASCD